MQIVVWPLEPPGIVVTHPMEFSLYVRQVH